MAVIHDGDLSVICIMSGHGSGHGLRSYAIDVNAQGTVFNKKIGYKIKFEIL